MTEQETQITPFSTVKPLVTPEEARKQWDDFEALKTALLTTDDYQKIADKQYIKKSGFRKIAVYFGLSDRILEEEKITREDDSFYWRIKAQVEAPNGRTSIGVAICDSRERKFSHLEHDVYTIAHTRAKNRAISDMVAGGIVSAEEVTPEEPEKPQRNPTRPRRKVPSQQREASPLKNQEKQAKKKEEAPKREIPRPPSKNAEELYTRVQGIIETLPIKYGNSLLVSLYDNKVYIQHEAGFSPEDKATVTEALGELHPKYSPEAMHWEVH